MDGADPAAAQDRAPGPLAGAGTGLPQVRGHIEALDGVRALAALMVLVFHVAIETGAALAPGVLGALLATGELGVPLFFALSGLLLYRPWARAAFGDTPGPRVRPYLWRRALRVLPAYWLVAVAALLLWSRDHLDSAAVWAQVMTLTYVFDTDPWYVGTGPYGLGQTWSLSVEVTFYALLPLIALLLTRAAVRGRPGPAVRGRRLLVGLALLTAVAVLALLPQYYPEPRPYMYAWLPRCLGMFAVGMALAVLGEWAWREGGRASGAAGADRTADPNRRRSEQDRPTAENSTREGGRASGATGADRTADPNRRRSEQDRPTAENSTREGGRASGAAGADPSADGPVRQLCRTLPRAATLCWLLAGAMYLLAATPAAGPRFVGVDGFWISLVSMATSMGFAFFVIAPVALRPARSGGPPPVRAGGGAWLEVLLGHRVMRYLGRISYGIFLWQFVVLYLWRDFTGQEIFTGSFWLDLVPVAAGTVLLADLTYRFVERPARRWYGAADGRRRKRSAARRARTPVN
ncbi:acyltransferase family protein [Streptomonospora nanhaiensis]|uniref:acyltransferase family protein n=2 Tax=Streptomonospora nanhaiensis TaxID=1323731 RepID=UPI0020CB6102